VVPQGFVVLFPVVLGGDFRSPLLVVFLGCFRDLALGDLMGKFVGTLRGSLACDSPLKSMKRWRHHRRHRRGSAPPRAQSGSGLPPRACDAPRKSSNPMRRTHGSSRGDEVQKHLRRDLIQGGFGRHAGPATQEDEGVIQELYGQLWLIPNPSPPHSCRHQGSRVHGEPVEDLVWIQKSLWESKTFRPKDCYQVTRRDSWRDEPKKLNFAAYL
jgi:hypothetical protein